MTDDSKSNNEIQQDDTFWGHIVAGIFLVGFSSSILVLTLRRLRRRIDLADFCQQHIPEDNPLVVRRISMALLGSTVFGLLYEGLGAKYLNQDKHPDRSFFFYTQHLTLTLLYMSMGFTGWLEYKGALPPDSTRVGLLIAQLGEVLLWYDHAMLKDDIADGRVHAMLALISAITSFLLLLSLLLPVVGVEKRQQPPNQHYYYYVINFTLYCGTSLGVFWQGLWFMTVAFHTIHPMAPHRISAFCILEALSIGFIVQLMALWLQQERQERRNNHGDNDDHNNMQQMERLKLHEEQEHGLS